MEAERLIDYEHEKQQERKRKGAHLEAIFEQNAKKSAQDTNENTIKDRMINKYSENGNLASACSPEIVAHNGKLENAVKSSASYRNPSGNTESILENPGNAFVDTGNLIGNPRSTSGNSVNPLRNARNCIGNTGSRMEHARHSSEISRSPVGKANNSMENTYHDSSCAPRERRGSDLESPERQTEPSLREGHHYTGFKQIQSSSPAKEKPSKGPEFQNTVTIKQEKTDNSPPVQDMPIQSQVTREKRSIEGEIGDECLKFLLFSGKLYHCERVSNLTHSFSKYIGDSVLGRKGKVVVLLLFHKTLREVLNYVVGVVDHYTLEEQNIIIKIIKHHTYPTTTIPTKEVEKSASKLVVGSKKLLYNLQPLHGTVYGELVKILDGFGANSAVDHAKISEFNAMVNANADRMDGQISNILGGVGYPYSGIFANRNFVPSNYSYIGSRFPQSNLRYSPQTNQPNVSNRYSPEKSHGASSHDRSKSVDAEIQSGYQRRANTSYYREGHHVNTVSANQTVRITPRTVNSNAEHIRTASVPIAPNNRFRSIEDGSLPSQRRNVEDLQTVAELCKEKMKRDMAEQELKSIKAAFEEFKSQMQQHLSQVEERMVLLEAENRTLKGKLSNMHQNNGFAEKKYHELRSQLEALLKST